MAISTPPGLDRDTLDRLYAASGAERWQVSPDEFASALQASLQKGFGENATPAAADLERYLASLHIEDLALACACAAGHDAAWDQLVRDHRAPLLRAADAMDPTGRARDLAESLFADLFGLERADGARRSLLRYFHGRSSLATWLRAVLAQRHVDRLRTDRRGGALPGDEAALPDPRPEPDPERSRETRVMRAALAHATSSLPPRDRLRLSCYYAGDLTLAEIGRLLGEHEATVSRHLARVRRSIRDAVNRYLAHEHGLNPAAIEACWRSVTQDAGPLDMREWLDEAPIRKIDDADRSKR